MHVKEVNYKWYNSNHKWHREHGNLTDSLHNDSYIRQFMVHLLKENTN